jgi:hypothetical protein
LRTSNKTNNATRYYFSSGSRFEQLQPLLELKNGKNAQKTGDFERVKA